MYDGICNMYMEYVKTYASSISKPLVIIFRNCFKNDCFPEEQKKANIVHVRKKNYKQLIKNYQLASLLPICVKNFCALIQVLNTWLTIIF